MTRVVYYTRPSFLDSALGLVRALSRQVELHLLVELAPEGWQNSLFDLAPVALPAGLVPADSVLRGSFPAGVHACWQEAASFHLAVHNCRRSIHPATWSVNRQVLRFVHSLEPDLLHLDDVTLRLLPWGLGRIPLVVSVHDPEPHTGEGGWRDDLARRLTFRHAQRFILHNQALQERFWRTYRLPRERVDAIPLGVYDVYREWIGRPVRANSRTVLFFGRLSPYKGLEALCQAAPLVAREVPGARFIIAGRPQPGYRLPRLPGLPNGGRFEVICYYIPNRGLAVLFQRASVGACPYASATQSGVVLTAYAFGKPVVASAVGGLPEYVSEGRTGLLVPSQDAGALAAALVRTLTDQRLQWRLRMGVARARHGRLSWGSIARHTAEAYARTLASVR